jgi:hypothetical protein
MSPFVQPAPVPLFTQPTPAPPFMQPVPTLAPHTPAPPFTQPMHASPHMHSCFHLRSPPRPHLRLCAACPRVCHAHVGTTHARTSIYPTVHALMLSFMQPPCLCLRLRVACAHICHAHVGTAHACTLIHATRARVCHTHARFHLCSPPHVRLHLRSPRTHLHLRSPCPCFCLHSHCPPAHVFLIDSFFLSHLT